jgi:hypothetical protein
MALLDAGMVNGETAARDAATRKPIGTMGVALGVFIGNIGTAILASGLYRLITHSRCCESAVEWAALGQAG